MKALLDTNIIIHRENIKVTNQSIGLLFYWLDKLKYEKMVHPYSIQELKKYSDQNMQELYDAKMSSYTQMKTIAMQDDKFIELLGDNIKTLNDKIDNQLLYELYSNRVDILITEDKKIRQNAVILGLSSQVFSINSFIEKCTSENPNLINYKVLSVKKEYIGNIDIHNVFFDSLKDNYVGFENWFAKKSNEEAYICYTDTKAILGFLYLKTEDFDENYDQINPKFKPMKRLKIGTFKVESTGFRLGERFVKIIFDNAIKRKVDEIYVTMFPDNPDVKALYELLLRWGFEYYGVKKTVSGEEVVLIKRLHFYNQDLSVKQNYPVIDYSKSKMILPIYAQYHTTLLPDSKLNTENEIDFIGSVPHRYALQKVYITWGMKDYVKVGDIVLFYRMGESNPKKYSSVLTTVGVIDQIIRDFNSKEEYLSYCQNRSVFTKKELEMFWDKHKYNLCVLKFIYIQSLTKRLTLEYLWKSDIIVPPNGPRPFTRISDEQFKQILQDSDTKIYEEK